MTTPIGILWTLLSIIVTGSVCFSFLQPHWFVHPDTLNALGMYSYCIQDLRFKDQLTQICGIYGGAFHFSNLPSNAWQAACVLYGAGCVLQGLGALTSITTLCVPRHTDRRLAVISGYVQLLAVLLLVAGLVVFPAGLDSKFVRHYCRGARMYESGACQVGWAYMLGIMGTALSFFCPFLSKYTDTKFDELQTV